MPNHTTNVLFVKGSQKKINELIKLVSGKETDFDFNKIIPMPQSLSITAGSALELSMTIAKYKSGKAKDVKKFQKMFNDRGPKLAHCKNIEEYIQELVKKQMANPEEGAIAIKNLEEYGHTDWYSWCVEKWGTKWNAYDCSDWTENALSFYTAWSPPIPVIEQLSKKFPSLTLTLKYADEGGGFLGIIQFKNGDCIDESELDWNSKEGKKLRDELGLLWDEDLEENTEEDNES